MGNTNFAMNGVCMYVGFYLGLDLGSFFVQECFLQLNSMGV
jgi:hypothetical protein